MEKIWGTKKEVIVPVTGEIQDALDQLSKALNAHIAYTFDGIMGQRSLRAVGAKEKITGNEGLRSKFVNSVRKADSTINKLVESIVQIARLKEHAGLFNPAEHNISDDCSDSITLEFGLLFLDFIEGRALAHDMTQVEYIQCALNYWFQKIETDDQIDMLKDFEAFKI